MSSEKIRVLVADDHAVVRLGVKALIEKNAGMMVCAEAGTLRDLYESLATATPDVVLLDIKLPDGTGVEGCLGIKKSNPGIKVIILTAFAESHIITDSISAGAEGFLLKNADGNTIISAINDVCAGKSILDPSVTKLVFQQVKGGTEGADSNLTKQEQEILRFICQGKTNREIGKLLSISEKTIRNYVSKILVKINAVNRTEAAAYWSERYHKR